MVVVFAAVRIARLRLLNKGNKTKSKKQKSGRSAAGVFHDRIHQAQADDKRQGDKYIHLRV